MSSCALGPLTVGAEVGDEQEDGDQIVECVVGLKGLKPLSCISLNTLIFLPT